MMDFHSYIINVTAVALIGGILSGFLKDGFTKELVKLLYGLLLTLSMLSPFSDIHAIDFTSLTEPFLMEGKEISFVGEKMAEHAMADIIKKETEAYIQNKAADYQASLTADVILKEMIPVSVILEGNISPYGKKQLEMMLENELNIPKENQQWT